MQLFLGQACTKAARVLRPDLGRLHSQRIMDGKGVGGTGNTKWTAEPRLGRRPAKPEGWRVNKGGVGEEGPPWGQILGAVAAAEQCIGQQGRAGRWRIIRNELEGLPALLPKDRCWM